MTRALAGSVTRGVACFMLAIRYNGKAFIFTLLVIILAALSRLFFVISYLSTKGGAISFADCIIWSVWSEGGIPFTWCVGPAIAIGWQIYSSRGTGSPSWILQHGAYVHIWIERLCRAVLSAAIVAAVSFVVFALAALLVSKEMIDFTLPHSLYAHYNSGPATENPSLVSVVVCAAGIHFLAILLFSTLFELIEMMTSNKAIPYFMIIVLGLPQVHGTEAVIADIGKSFDWGIFARNPLSYLYEGPNVFYGSWVPGATHGFWIVVSLKAVMACIGYLWSKRRGGMRCSS